MQPHTAPGTPAQLFPGSHYLSTPVSYSSMGVQGPFPQLWCFGESGGIFAHVTAIPFSSWQWHYE